MCSPNRCHASGSAWTGSRLDPVVRSSRSSSRSRPCSSPLRTIPWMRAWLYCTAGPVSPVNAIVSRGSNWMFFSELTCRRYIFTAPIAMSAAIRSTSSGFSQYPPSTILAFASACNSSKRSSASTAFPSRDLRRPIPRGKVTSP